MVWQKEGLNYSYQQVARNVCVDKATMYRTVQRFRRIGLVIKEPYPKASAHRLLTKPAELLILNLVVSKPGIYLHEIQAELIDTLLLQVSISTICTFLHKSGFTRRKIGYIAIQQDQFLREQFISDVSVFDPEMFVYVDETGSDRRNRLRNFGYSLRGKPLRNQVLLARGERISAIACMSTSGILDVKTVKGTTNDDIFYDFVNQNLLRYLQPYNGVNPHSVVIMDNCSIHHIEEISEVIRDVGALLIYLLPYSPDLNPIEEAFSKVKYCLKAVTIDDQMDMETIVLVAFSHISIQDCNGWISHCKIYT